MAHPTRIFHEPEEMMAAFEGYKEFLKEEANEWFKVQYVGKFAERKTDNYKLPYTFDGFLLYCYNNHGDVEAYFSNRGGYYDVFTGVCSRIKKAIRDNQIQGGLLGVYNPSITQRLNNLAENTIAKVEVKPAIDYSQLSDSALDEILALENKQNEKLTE